MNPALFILIIIGAIIIWFLLSFVFYPLGKLVSKSNLDLFKTKILKLIKKEDREDNKKKKNEKDEKENI